MTDNNQADTVIMLSSELIAEVIEGYFNKVMFKQKVTVVDLQPSSNGYAFSLKIEEKVSKKGLKDKEVDDKYKDYTPKRPRDEKGRFLPE